jgi:signal transduction histidine kinase
MRARLILLVAATSLLVVVAFLVPLAMLVRSAAADRAVGAAAVQVQALAPIVTSADRATLRTVVEQANAGNPHQVTVFLPDGTVVGAPARRSAAVDLATAGRSVTGDAPGGREVLVAVAGLPDGTAVIRTLVGDPELGRGVARAWAVLGLLGLGLVVLSVLVADQLARAFIRPLAAVADVSHQMAGGNLDVRATTAGPPEVRAVSNGLNLLVDRIGEMLRREREHVVDLSHRLRTPLTTLRIDAEGLTDPAEQARIVADVDALERTVNDIIHTARRLGRPNAERCDAVRVIADRIEFWSALADEEGRTAQAVLDPGPVPVGVSEDALAACVDALLGNVFAHTPVGTGFTVSLHRRAPAGARLVVADRGPGWPPSLIVRRGSSGGGSTGLGLDIATRTATASGGSMALAGEPGGGAIVILDLGAPTRRRGERPSGRGTARPDPTLAVQTYPGS